MTRAQIEQRWTAARIEYTDDGRAFVHAGGAYPLILDIEDE